jgi:RecA/RadA recombinase
MAKKTTKKETTKETTDSIVEQIETRPKDSLYVPLDTNMVVSTGSTLLDLAISGNRVRGGGLPGGIIVEIFGPPSCVDGATEYMAPTGWKRISEYHQDDLVLQYNIEDETAEFVEPFKYIEAPATKMYEFRNTYLNQCLSLNHTVVYRYRKRKKPVLNLPFSEVLRQQVESTGGFEGQFITGFNIKNTPGVSISDAQLRVMVMSIGDGSFDKRRPASHYCVVNLKKDRKINRAKELLRAANIQFRAGHPTPEYTRFYYQEPTVNTKEFPAWLFLCTQHQLKVIANEAVHWDGNTRDAFYSTNKSSADFIQYAFLALGGSTHIGVDNRPNKPITYIVSRRKNKYVTLHNGYGEKQKFYEYTPPDGLQYCFEVPSGCLVLRRENKIFITGNSGKTALLVEICSSAQAGGGEVLIADPEARLDKEYANLFGLKIPKEGYHRPNTVTELTKLITSWKPKNDKVINILAADSIAALSTDMEMGDGDKRGQRKAKELSELCRVKGREIAHGHRLVLLTNQERQGDYGKTTPGGFAVPYHASLRIRVARAGARQIEASRKTKSGKVLTKIVGIESECTIVKSSISNEYQKARIYVIFGLGIDDIRANLIWLKQVQSLTKFPCVNKEHAYINNAIKYIEQNNLEAELRKNVINTWEAIERLFCQHRKKKVRF